MRFIVELLHSGYTPQEVVAAWDVLREVYDTLPERVSVATVQRIAKEWGLSQPRGGPAGRAYRGGGRPLGSTKRAGTAEAVRVLRGAGFSWADIATQLGLGTKQNAQRISKLVAE